jgi:hypothetical protein
LYYFGGIWVDLDERQRPIETPQVFGWATPEGWRKGLRPPQREDSQEAKSTTNPESKNASATHQDKKVSPENNKLIQQIEAMAEPLGKGMYRGLLKGIARVWNPSDIRDSVVLKNVLTSMQSAARGLRRLEAAQERVGPDELKSILTSLKIKSLDRVDNLETLREVVLALETKADQVQDS